MFVCIDVVDEKEFVLFFQFRPPVDSGESRVKVKRFQPINAKCSGAGPSSIGPVESLRCTKNSRGVTAAIVLSTERYGVRMSPKYPPLSEPNRKSVEYTIQGYMYAVS